MKLKAVWIVAVVIAAANTGTALFGAAGHFPLLDERSTMVIGDSLPVAASILAVLLLLGPLRMLDEWESLKFSWAALLAGIGLSSLAEITYGTMETVLGMDMDANFPSVADVFWLSGYIFILAGLLMKLWSYKKSGLGMGKPVFHVILAAVFAAVAGTVWALQIAPILGDGDLGAMEKAVMAAYPLLDLVVLGPAITLAYIASLFGGGRVAGPWRMIAAGLCLWAVSDIYFNYLELNGSYTSGHWVDFGWNLSYVLVGAGALLQRDLLASFSAGGDHA